ncbi:MAG: cell division protein SepF, partial [Dolichospermum sp.]
HEVPINQARPARPPVTPTSAWGNEPTRMAQ